METVLPIARPKWSFSPLFLDVSESTSHIQYDQKLIGFSFIINGKPDQLSMDCYPFSFTWVHYDSLFTSLPSAICPCPYRRVARDMARITLLEHELDDIILLHKTLQGFPSPLKWTQIFPQCPSRPCIICPSFLWPHLLAGSPVLISS